MWQVERQLEFTGGENRKVIPQLAAPNQLIRAQNCVLTADGLVQTRLGKVKLNSTTLGAGAVLSVHLYPKQNGTNLLMVQHGTSLYEYDWDGDAFTTFGTAVKTGLTASAKLRSVVWKDNIIFTNGVDTPFRYDGTTFTNLVGPPPDSYLIKVYANRLWLVDAANPNQLRYSELEDYDDWPALNVILVRDDDGDFITNISPQNGGLVVFKNRSVYTLYGTNRQNFRLTDPIAHSVGCPSYDGVLDDGLFMGNDNWYQFSLVGITPLPETHSPLLDEATGPQKEAAFAVTQGSQQRFYFKLASDIVVFDAKRMGVTSWDDLNANCFCSAEAEGFNGDLLVGDADNGFVYKITGDDDDGTAIETWIKTGYTDHGTAQNKVWRYAWPDIDVFIDSTTLNDFFYKYDVDFTGLTGSEARVAVNEFLVYDVDNWDEAQWGIGYYNINTPYWLHNVKGRYISHELYATNRIRFKGYSAKFRVIGRI